MPKSSNKELFKYLLMQEVKPELCVVFQCKHVLNRLGLFLSSLTRDGGGGGGGESAPLHNFVNLQL